MSVPCLHTIIATAAEQAFVKSYDPDALTYAPRPDVDPGSLNAAVGNTVESFERGITAISNALALLATFEDAKYSLNDDLTDIFTLVGTLTAALSDLRELAYIAERSRDQVRNPPQTAKRGRLRTAEFDKDAA